MAQSENESEEEQVIDDDTLSQFLGIVSQDDKQRSIHFWIIHLAD